MSNKEMRDPKRIERILDLIKEVWINSSDMRLTQIIVNACTNGSWRQTDIFHCEDNVTEVGLRKSLENINDHLKEKK